MRPAQLGLLALLVLVLARALPLPVLDEEAWLDIARQASLAHPYDWWRAGPPWGTGREADAFVFAHPPLFIAVVKAATSLTRHLAEQRVLAAAPFGALLGLSLGALAGAGPRPSAAVAAAVGSPVLVMAACSGLMPDLAVTSLMMGSLAAWFEGWREPERGAKWWATSGALLALAAFTKYPALVLAPVIGLDAARRRGIRQSWPVWVGFLLPWLVGEGWLAAVYGRVHLLEVLARASEIPRGPVAGRLLGVLTRLGLAICPLLLGRAGMKRALLPGFLLGGLALALGWPVDLGGAGRACLLVLAVLGGAWVAFAADLLARSWRPVGAERQDTFALAALVLLVVLGVVLGHNYASPRYLLPALPPLGLLASRGISSRWSMAGGALGLALGALLVRAESRYAEAANEVGTALASGSAAPGYYTGEWTFRWRMSQEGWTWTDQAPPSGSVVAIPKNAAPALEPQAGWSQEAASGVGRGSLRVLDLDEGVGFYAETLGALPLGWRDGRLEEGALWRVR